MDGDKFISTNKSANLSPFANEENDNFFLHEDSGMLHISQPEPKRHLNDYDSNILQEGAYREVSDTVLKMEYKISRIENEINELDKQILLANEVNDSILSGTLDIKKTQLEQELKDLLSEYRDVSISAKISGNFTTKIRDKIDNTRKMLGMYGETFLSKFSSKWSSFLEVKNSLTKLENINKSVDELMSVQYPYGEACDKYEKLSKYIARANAIQAEIYKFIK